MRRVVGSARQLAIEPPFHPRANAVVHGLGAPELLADMMAWTETFPEILDDLEGLLTDNRIFKQRNVDIGVVSLDECF